MSVFSDLNQLKEIGLDPAFSCLCGITEKELLANFTPELESLAEAGGQTFEETLAAVRKNFNGYRFAKNSESVYNPFSVLNTFSARDIRHYWFATGTPTFLFKELERTGFDPLAFRDGIEAPDAAVNDYRFPLFFSCLLYRLFSIYG